MTQREIHNYKCTASPHILNKAISELHEDPNTRHLEIQTLRERLQRHTGLNSRLDDVFLLKFLRARKFDQERTYDLVLKYYQMKLDNSDIYTQMYPSCLEDVMNTGLQSCLEHRAKDGSKVLIARPSKWDPNSSDIDDVFRITYLAMSDAVEDEETQVCGIRYIVDMEGLTWQQCRSWTPSFAKKFAGLLQDGFPNRLKGIHYVHEPTFFDIVFAILRPFLKDKLVARLRFHGDKVEDLHEYIDPEYLPKEYGGKLPPLDHRPWVEHMMKQDAHYQEDNKFGLFHMQMQQQKKTEDAIEEMAGAYRKLNVD